LNHGTKSNTSREKQKWHPQAEQRRTAWRSPAAQPHRPPPLSLLHCGGGKEGGLDRQPRRTAPRRTAGSPQRADPRRRRAAMGGGREAAGGGGRPRRVADGRLRWADGGSNRRRMRRAAGQVAVTTGGWRPVAGSRKKMNLGRGYRTRSDTMLQMKIE